MKKWININKELPPLKQKVRYCQKYDKDSKIYTAMLFKDYKEKLWLEIRDESAICTYAFDDKTNGFWEKEIILEHELIKTRFEILDL